MSARAELDTQDKDESSIGARIGRVRWTICAMLFAATSINYMDRSVIAILKPTLMKPFSEHGVGMTEVGYGHITAAFMIAYAIGLLVAGRFIDKVGTRIGYMVIMAVWSLSAMGHALANSVIEFGIMRFTLGLGESGNFPAAIKGRRCVCHLAGPCDFASSSSRLGNPGSPYPRARTRCRASLRHGRSPFERARRARAGASLPRPPRRPARAERRRPWPANGCGGWPRPGSRRRR